MHHTGCCRTCKQRQQHGAIAWPRPTLPVLAAASALPVRPRHGCSLPALIATRGSGRCPSPPPAPAASGGRRRGWGWPSGRRPAAPRDAAASSMCDKQSKARTHARERQPRSSRGEGGSQHKGRVAGGGGGGGGLSSGPGCAHAFCMAPTTCAARTASPFQDITSNRFVGRACTASPPQGTANRFVGRATRHQVTPQTDIRTSACLNGRNGPLRGCHVPPPMPSTNQETRVGKDVRKHAQPKT